VTFAGRGGFRRVVHELFKDPLEVSERVGSMAADLPCESGHGFTAESGGHGRARDRCPSWSLMRQCEVKVVLFPRAVKV
jgi:hypothetical protein